MSIRGLIWRRVLSPAISALLRLRGRVECGRHAVFYGLPLIAVSRGARVSIGDRAVLCSKSEFTALGVSKRVTIRAMQAGAEVTIGSDVGFSGTVICSNRRVTIGNQCLFGADVVVCDTDFHPIAPAGRRYAQEGVRSDPVSIGDNVFVGARSVVLKGVSIGRNSVIGAGSVVSSNIPENVIAAGNPCRVIRALDFRVA